MEKQHIEGHLTTFIPSLFNVPKGLSNVRTSKSEDSKKKDVKTQSTNFSTAPAGRSLQTQPTHLVSNKTIKFASN